ncbi:MAG: helix-turn-helix domain-containing protein [Gemmataceae bacterium]
MAVCPSQHAPQTPADFERITLAGVRTIERAAIYMGKTITDVRRLVRTGAIWSYRRGKRRVVPVAEMRRYLAREAMECSGHRPAEEAPAKRKGKK